MRRGTSRGEGPRYYETGSQSQAEDHSGAGMCRLVGGCVFLFVSFSSLFVRCGAVRCGTTTVASARTPLRADDDVDDEDDAVAATVCLAFLGSTTIHAFAILSYII